MSRLCRDCGNVAEFIIEPVGEYDEAAWDAIPTCGGHLAGNADWYVYQLDHVQVSFAVYEAMTACAAPSCDRTDTRLYLNGKVCPDHTPARAAGRQEPPTGDSSWMATARPTLAGALGGSDINKTRPGGYVSRQKAKKIAEQRDAFREAAADEAANIIYDYALKHAVLSANECRAEFIRREIKEGARGSAWGLAVKRGWLRHCGSVKSTDPATKGHRLSAYTSLVYEGEKTA